MLESVLISILLNISQLLGIATVPMDSAIWNIDKSWTKVNNGFQLEAVADISKIGCNPRSELIFPQVVHGVHELFDQNNLLYQSGDPTFEQMTPFYKRGSISCNVLLDHRIVKWRVTTYSKYFARLQSAPTVSLSASKFYFFDVLANVLATGCLLILCLFTAFLFIGKIEIKMVIPLLSGCSFFCLYALFSCADSFGIKISMFLAHKIADLSLWAGFLSYLQFFRKNFLVGKIEFNLFISSFIIGQSLIIFANKPDLIQVGTTFPMPFSFICLMSILARETHLFKTKEWNFNSLFASLSVLCFVIVGCNDLFHIFGVIDSYMLIPLGSVFGVFFLAAAVNQDIEKTYLERDDLVINLQDKVTEQTVHLSSALEQVKKSQVDLVQSARLASLGTLSAGIAHEINNAINFVNGAVVPLERKVMKHIPEGDRVITEKLFAAIKEGTHLTVEIVRSLRNFTGLNQAKVKDVNVRETVTSVVTILKSKLNHINVEIEIEENLVLNCYQVGLNQIFMNLISNAIDVLPASKGSIKIAAKNEGPNHLTISVADNGTGMTDEVKSRIFDPFFTTKDVGKGTGLGLHIVQKEVERHSGSVYVQSVVGKGTAFIIKLPRNIETKDIKDAA